MNCLKCGTVDDFKKNGFVQKKQRYKCKSCGYQMSRLTPRGRPIKEKNLALVLYLSGLSMNMSGKIIGVSTQCVMQWLKKAAISVLPKLHHQSRDVSEIAQELQVDEMYHFIQKKRLLSGSGKSSLLNIKA